MCSLQIACKTTHHRLFAVVLYRQFVHTGWPWFICCAALLLHAWVTRQTLVEQAYTRRGVFIGAELPGRRAGKQGSAAQLPVLFVTGLAHFCGRFFIQGQTLTGVAVLRAVHRSAKVSLCAGPQQPGVVWGCQGRVAVSTRVVDVVVHQGCM